MSYEPTLIIRKADLIKAQNPLYSESYSGNFDEQKIAKFLLNVLSSQTVKFDNLELLICHPELTEFNKQIREKLFELEVEYEVYN